MDSQTLRAICKSEITIITFRTTVFSLIWIISQCRSCRCTLSSSLQSINQFQLWGRVQYHHKAFCRHFLQLHRSSSQSTVQSSLEQSVATQCRQHRHVSRTKMTPETVGGPGKYSSSSYKQKFFSSDFFAQIIRSSSFENIVFHPNYLSHNKGLDEIDFKFLCYC